MKPLGRIVTAGVGIATAASLLTAVTTAYMIRPAAPTAAMAATPVPAVVRSAPVTARVVPAVSRTVASAPQAIPVEATSSSSSQCASGDRAWRIAKPGAIGGLVGAGLGAAGGAIANGGSGAGKGALIGGLLGVATGAGYGAYQTKNECGTILGKGFTDPLTASQPAAETALRPRSVNDDITVYPVR